MTGVPRKYKVAPGTSNYFCLRFNCFQWNEDENCIIFWNVIFYIMISIIRGTFVRCVAQLKQLYSPFQNTPVKISVSVAFLGSLVIRVWPYEREKYVGRIYVELKTLEETVKFTDTLVIIISINSMNICIFRSFFFFNASIELT